MLDIYPLVPLFLLLANEFCPLIIIKIKPSVFPTFLSLPLTAMGDISSAQVREFGCLRCGLKANPSAVIGHQDNLSPVVTAKIPVRLEVLLGNPYYPLRLPHVHPLTPFLSFVVRHMPLEELPIEQVVLRSAEFQLIHHLLSPSPSITPLLFLDASFSRLAFATSSRLHPITSQSPESCHRMSPASAIYSSCLSHHSS